MTYNQPAANAKAHSSSAPNLSATFNDLAQATFNDPAPSTAKTAAKKRFETWRECIEFIRKEYETSVYGLATLLDVDDSNAYNWHRGKNVPPERLRVKFEELFGAVDFSSLRFHNKNARKALTTKKTHESKASPKPSKAPKAPKLPIPAAKEPAKHAAPTVEPAAPVSANTDAARWAFIASRCVQFQQELDAANISTAEAINFLKLYREVHY